MSPQLKSFVRNFAFRHRSKTDAQSHEPLAITDQQTAEIAHLTQQLALARDENAVMATIVRHASDGLLIQDIDGHIEWSNPAYSRITGYGAQELQGRKAQEFLLPPENAMSAEDIEAFKHDISKIHDTVEILRNVRKNGEIFWNQLSLAVVENGSTRESKVIIISRDITEQIEREESLKRAREETQFRAEHDALTGLPNRIKLTRFISDALHNSSISKEEVGVLHVDLDHFKEVNDTLGHAAGDSVLVHAANVMKSHARQNDLVCRFGGDEFIIVCPGISEFQPLEDMAKRIIADLKRPMPWGDHKISFGSSIGISISSETARGQGELIRQADAALYEVKNNGRNGFLSYNDEIGDMVSRRTKLSASLSRAFTDNQLGVLLQPQFDLSTKSVTGFEALIRWHHPQWGLLSPADFLGVAETNGRMEEVDAMAITGALDALSTLHDAGFPHLNMAINVSAQMLNRPDYVDKLKWEVERRDLSPSNIVIEVLETVVIQNSDNTVTRTINTLSEAGFAVELDDFGTGYSGLTNLAQLKLSGVKIDRSLVQDAPNDHTSQVIIKAIFRLCKDLNLQVISEGVETPEQADFLRQNGGSIIQGFGVARPMTLESAVHWLGATDMDAVLTASDDDKISSAM